MKTDEELADEKIKEMFPNSFCIGGNYEGYKKAILEGIKIGKTLGEPRVNMELSLGDVSEFFPEET